MMLKTKPFPAAGHCVHCVCHCARNFQLKAKDDYNQATKYSLIGAQSGKSKRKDDGLELNQDVKSILKR